MDDMKIHYRQLDHRTGGYVLTLVSTHFATLINESNRGPNFSWDKFPEMARRYVEASLFLYFEDGEKIDKKLAGDAAVIMAKTLLKLSGLDTQ